MRAMLDEIEALPDGALSPWHDPERLLAWQDGTAVDFDAPLATAR